MLNWTEREFVSIVTGGCITVVMMLYSLSHDRNEIKALKMIIDYQGRGQSKNETYIVNMLEMTK